MNGRDDASPAERERMHFSEMGSRHVREDGFIAADDLFLNKTRLWNQYWLQGRQRLQEPPEVAEGRHPEG